MKTKYLTLTISILTTLLLISCGSQDEPGYRDWSGHIPLKKTDSIAAIKIYKALDCMNWKYEGPDEIKKATANVDLEDYESWDMFKMSYNYETKENEIRELTIDSNHYPESVFHDGFQFPLEFNLLNNLRTVRIKLYDEPGRSYTDFVDFPITLFNNPIEELEISGERFGGTVPCEISKLSETLKKLTITHTCYSEIPEEMALLSNLEMNQTLTYNRFHGKVPYFPYNHPLRYSNLSWNQYTEMNWEYFREDYNKIDHSGEIVKCPTLFFNPISGEVPDDIMNSRWWETCHYRLCGFLNPGFSNCKFCKKKQ